MATISVEKKRESIDLPVEVFHKLSLMAASQGKSLKTFIENLLITRANVSACEDCNPSPTADPWFNKPENIASVMRGIEDIKHGRTKTYTIDEIKELLGA